MIPEYKNDYLTGFIISADDILNHLINNINWLQSTEVRKEYFMSDNKIDYTYGRGPGQRTYSSNKMDLIVDQIMKKINSDGYNFNACFLNRYENEKNQLGWHSDIFEGADSSYPIAVISLGAEREIWWKENDFKGIIPKQNRRLLEHGSLFIMPENFQFHYQHRIPKHDRPCGIRVSLTFRKFD